MELTKLKVEIQKARERIKSHVRKTPLEFSHLLSEKGKANVYLKLEIEQVTGSFKARGAFNKLCIMLEKGKDYVQANPPVTASSGNHALACTHAMRKLGIQGTIVVPKTVSTVKKEALQRLGANLLIHGDDCVDGENFARKTAEERGTEFISPYNDWDVIAGQGTIGIELEEDLDKIDTILVPVGGGGLIGGIASYIKAVKPEVKIIGCQPRKSKVMYECVKKGKILFEESFETLSDGTAGGVEENSVTLGLCTQYVDEWILVEEEEIEKAVFFMVDQHHKIVEGAAGVAVGAYMVNADKFKGQNVIIIACGGNISTSKLKEILNKYS